MRKRIFSFTLLLAILALTFNFSCQKSPNQINDAPREIIIKTDSNYNSINSNNPYDSSFYYYWIEALLYVNNTQDTSECDVFDDYFDNWKDYADDNPPELITYDTSDVDDIIIDSVGSFIDILSDTTLSLQGFLNKAFAFENRIANDANLTTVQKNFILHSTACLKQIRFIFETENFYVTVGGETYQLEVPQSWEELLNACIEYQLGLIFNSGNPVTIALFIAGLPWSFWSIVASCAWTASQQYWNW
jgi:hypothetical protein